MKRNLIAAAAVAALRRSRCRRRPPTSSTMGKLKAPAAPALKPVTVDPKTTALLMLDFMNQNCGKRPRCLATMPAMKKLLDEARAAKAPVIYSASSPTRRPPTSSRMSRRWRTSRTCCPARTSSCNTDLEKILKDKGIKTVIAVGTASNGAVLFTASGAAFRGMNVIVPVDGMSAVDRRTPNDSTRLCSTSTNARRQCHRPKTTLTTSDMIKF